MLPRIVLLHDAAAAAGRPDSSDTLLEAQAIAAALAEPRLRDGDAAGRARPRRPRARAARARAARRLQSRRVARGPRPALARRSGAARVARRAVHGLLRGRARARRRTSSRRKGCCGKPISRRRPCSAGRATTGPWIVKSVCEHASLGHRRLVGRPWRDAAARTLEARRAEFGGEWFAERFVPGRELNVAIIAAPTGPRVLPVAELRFEGFPADKPRSSAMPRSGTSTASSTATRSARSTSSRRSQRARSSSRSPAGSCSRSTAMRASIFASTR